MIKSMIIIEKTWVQVETFPSKSVQTSITSKDAKNREYWYWRSNSWHCYHGSEKETSRSLYITKWEFQDSISFGLVSLPNKTKVDYIPIVYKKCHPPLLVSQATSWIQESENNLSIAYRDLIGLPTTNLLRPICHGDPIGLSTTKTNLSW